MDELPLIEPVVGEDELDNIRSVLDSGWMTEGPFAEQLQEEVSELAGAEHAIAVTSCTTGLELALDALDIGPGDKVIVPAFTYPATANVVVRLGATPVLVDVDRETYTIDPAAVSAAVTPDTAAIMPVSLMGYPLDAEPIADIAGANDLAVVEDAAPSLGASRDGERVGSQFDASVFSFHPRKVLTTGEGGAVVTDDTDLEREMRTIKNFGTSHYEDRDGFVRANATNYRLSDVLAAIGVAQLEKATEIIERRREIASWYDDRLADVDGIDEPTVADDAYHIYQSYCAYVEAGDDDARDAIIESLSEQNIGVGIGSYALHETDAFVDAERVGSLEISRNLYRNLLSLPISHGMDEEDVDRVVAALEAALANL
jgi:dTDP-4-amino-4,6-dideoxygalactose transaminase